MTGNVDAARRSLQDLARAADVRGLIQERGAQSALLVGHDWGGTVARATTMAYPEMVDRLAILNVAHPQRS